MHLDSYALDVGESGQVFEFASEGPRGRIEKLVVFTEMQLPEVYNLGFGDKSHLDEEFDDLVRSDNGDTQKVLATVVRAVVAFLDLHPRAIVYACGSTPARTRLYQMGISRHLDAILRHVEVQGRRGDQWEPFERGREYSEFVARKK